MVTDPMEDDLKTIKYAIERYGVTQKEIAAKLSLSQSAVSNMLSGKRQLKHAEFRALLDMLDRHSNQLGTRHRNLPIYRCVDAANWLSEPDQVGQMTIGLPSGRPSGRFGVLVENEDISDLISQGGVAIIDPELTDLFEDQPYAVRFGSAEPCLRVFRGNPGRLETVPRIGKVEASPIGSVPFEVIGRVIASVKEF